MMSVPVWLPGPMFLPAGGSLSRGSVSKGSLSRGVSVQRGLCPEVSLSRRRPYGKERAVRILLECLSC